MRASSEIHNMAVFCDFENIALGAREAKFERFEIRVVLEKLLVKGSIVVKKAYCDWERYKAFKAGMHEAAFELIEIPHLRQSGKNSADIRLVVDALDLCYTKAHVDAFVIVSGDSDFSPLVSKLRENNKRVIGVGVRASTSDLLIRNCDEFLFYDDLARADETRRAKAPKPAAPKAAPRPATGRTRAGAKALASAAGAAPAEPQGDPAPPPAEPALAHKKQLAIDLVAETFQALVAERGSDERILPSQLKQALIRRHPEFSEAAYGYKLFGRLLDDAAARALLRLTRDDKSGQTHVRLAAA